MKTTTIELTEKQGRVVKQALSDRADSLEDRIGNASNEISKEIYINEVRIIEEVTKKLPKTIEE